MYIYILVPQHNLSCTKEETNEITFLRVLEPRAVQLYQPVPKILTLQLGFHQAHGVIGDAHHGISQGAESSSCRSMNF